jgi:uncharacterized protein (TIGR02001 family)
VTAPAPGPPGRPPSPTDRGGASARAAPQANLGFAVLVLAVALVSVLGAAPAARSQAAASATLVSNYLYRGLALSDGQPALDLTVAYDDASGVYAGASAIGDMTRRQGPKGLGELGYVGYAVRPGTGPTVDLGVQVLNYRTYGAYPADRDAVEAFAGVTAGHLNAYLHYSPDYLNSGARTLYGEANGAARLARRWRLIGHVGVLAPVGGANLFPARFDVSAAIAWALKRGDLRLAWTTTRPNQNHGAPYAQGRGVLALGVTWPF